MNSVFMIGRLVKDPQVRKTQSGQSVCGFVLAVDKGLSKAKRDEAEQAGRPTADFPTCQAWGTSADLLERYCHKGSKIAIEGRLQTGSFEDKDTVKTVYTTDVVVSRLEFLESKSQGQERAKDDDYFGEDFEEVKDDGRIPF